MSPDDDILRDALRDDAGRSTPSADTWSKVRDRATSIRRRRRVVERGTALLAAAAIAAGVVVATDVLGEEDEHSIATTTGAEIVAVQGPNNGGDALVILSADDGHVIRTLTEDIGITFGGISATPDGQTIYFARRRTALPCDRVEIAKVSRDGGDVEVIGLGINPVVSPDGSTIAFVRPPVEDPCGPYSERVWRDLNTGDESVFTVNEVRDRVGSHSFPLAWAPDGSALLMAGAACQGPTGEVQCTNEIGSGVMMLPMRTSRESDFGGTRFLDLERSTPATGATYLPDGRILVAVTSEEPPSGAQLHELVVFEGAVGPAKSDPPTSDDFLLEPIETILESRQPGVLRISASSAGDVLMHFGGDLLQRWSPGDAEPTTITSDVGDAAWLPRAQSSPDVTTTTTLASVVAPNQMVVARADRTLDVINADGSVVRGLGTASLDYHTLALAPDGVTLYYEQGGSDLCRTGAEIGRVRIDESTLTFEFLTNGAFMSLSQDGTKLAYRSGGCGVDGSLVVRDITTGEERSFSLEQPNDDGPFAELVGAVGWDADNQHLMLRVNREPSTEFWYVDIESVTGRLTGPAFAPRGEQGAETGPTNFAPLATTGRWAVVVANVGGPSLTEYDLLRAGDPFVRPLAELPDRGVEIAGSDPTGQHLLLLVPSEGGFDLYRWSAGDAVTTFVAEGVVAADW